MPRVRFMVTRRVRDDQGEIVDTFVSGKGYDLSDPAATRWIRRFDAVRVENGEDVPLVSPSGCSIWRDEDGVFVVVGEDGRTVGQTPLRGEAVALAGFD